MDLSSLNWQRSAPIRALQALKELNDEKYVPVFAPGVPEQSQRMLMRYASFCFSRRPDCQVSRRANFLMKQRQSTWKVAGLKLVGLRVRVAAQDPLVETVQEGQMIDCCEQNAVYADRCVSVSLSAVSAYLQRHCDCGSNLHQFGMPSWKLGLD